MSRQSAIIPVSFANAPAPPSSEPTVNLDSDFNYLLGLIQDSSNGFVNSVADTGATNSYVVTLPSTIVPSGYTNGMTVVFLVLNTNSGSSTINVNGLGSVPIITSAGNALTQGYLSAGNVVMLVYYNGNFYLISTPPSLILNQDLGITSSSGATISCGGYNQINVSVNYNGSGPFTLTLNNLGIGATLNWIGKNSSGLTRQLLIVAGAGTLNTAITQILGLGYYSTGTGYNQVVDLFNGTNNTILNNQHWVYQVVVQNLATNPVMIGSFAAAA